MKILTLHGINLNMFGKRDPSAPAEQKAPPPAPAGGAAIATRLSRKHADLLAIPEVDPTGRRIDWYAPFEGQTRKLSELDDSERQAILSEVHRLHGEITGLAEIAAVADVYDALISRRVYKPPFPHEQAVQIISEGRGKHFDPDMVDAFLQVAEDFRSIAATFADTDRKSVV